MRKKQACTIEYATLAHGKSKKTALCHLAFPERETISDRGRAAEKD
jgi:hypothetical protein